MITKNDCLSVLVQLEDKGIDVDTYLTKLLSSKEIPLDVLKFIQSHRGIEVANFYEMLRKKHNKDRSPLYTNILRGQTDISEIVVTMSCLLTQIALYGKKLETPDEFFREVRAEEITRVLNAYYRENNIGPCFDMMQVLKSDILVLEYIGGRRELEK